MTDYTLHEASKVSGLSRSLLSQAAFSGKLRCAMREVANSSNSKHPRYIVSEEELNRFTEKYKADPESMTKIVLASASKPRVIPDEERVSRENRQKIERMREARECGMSLADYMEAVGVPILRGQKWRSRT